MNVFEAATQRIEWALTEFDYCYVSFSGGKDSGVMLELTAQIARRLGKRWGIYHMDYEAQYQLTTDYVRETLDRYRNEADIYHVCVPFMVTTCTSMFQSYWRPWEPVKQDIWVRPMPEGAMTIRELPFWSADQWDYALLLQASRRTYRTGQEQDCHYYELTGNVGLEHMMAENIKKKVSMSEYLKKITKEELYERL